MSLAREFENIDILLRNRTKTTGIDCFSLSVIKMERQMRRLFTYSIFQFPCFKYRHIPALIDALVDENSTYFGGFRRGFEMIHPRSVRDLVGPDYLALWPVIEKAILQRNKIFHGQLTPDRLSTAQLLAIVESIRGWCGKLGEGSNAYFGYSGFDYSFRKAADRGFVAGYRVPISSVADYKDFLVKHLRARKLPRKVKTP